MLTIPTSLKNSYIKFLGARGMNGAELGLAQKWLRFYLDFCLKYKHDTLRPESLSAFMGKLIEKKQSSTQRQQANNAIALYFEFIRLGDGTSNKEDDRKEIAQKNTCSLCVSDDVGAYGQHDFTEANPSPHRIQGKREGGTRIVTKTHEMATAKARYNVGLDVQQDVPGQQQDAKKTTKGASWQAQLERLHNEIKMRHYSPATLRSYRNWVRKFQTYTKSKAPALLTAEDVKGFLTFLAVEEQVSASSQNLAFNSLLFFFRNVLEKDFGKIDGVVRAKKRPYIPVVLAREEIDAVLEELESPYDLIVKILYGCGLRLFECIGLRVQCLNFDAGLITVHDGKGKKDRTVPLPQSIVHELKRHVTSLQELHKEDLRKEYAGVFLVNALEKKYKNAGKEFVWQWLFPAKQLTLEKGTKSFRRYHLHQTHVQKAIKKAVNDAGICKRATAHTFRHSFASHLLQHNVDIRTIQQLLGHSDLRTTMIYTHTIKSTTIKEAVSPLDL